MITAELLTRIPLFARIPPNELASLAGRAADVRLHQNEWLILEQAFVFGSDGYPSKVQFPLPSSRERRIMVLRSSLL